MVILLIHDNREAAEKIQFFVESTYGAKVLKSFNYAEATAELKKSLDIQLIIFDKKKDGSAEEKAFWIECAKIPTIICTSDDQEELTVSSTSLIRRIDKKKFTDNLVRAVTDLLKRGI